MATNSPDVSLFDSFHSGLTFFAETVSQGLLNLSYYLDQQFGAETTTALVTSLGLISLVLAVYPLWASWRQQRFQSGRSTSPSQLTVPEPADAVPEVVEMHPERLQQLYGVSLAPAAAARTVQASAALDESPSPEPMEVSQRPLDLALGLIADLSESLSQQKTETATLRELLNQHQQLIELLTAQMKAQSSAFLLQGERLLQLESGQGRDLELNQSASEGSSRLSTFDQAISLAAAGASVEQLMAECELSQSEARLVALVHGPHA